MGRSLITRQRTGNYMSYGSKKSCRKMRNCHDKQFYDDMMRRQKAEKYRQLAFVHTTYQRTSCNRETIIQFNHSSSAANFAQSLKHLIFMIACVIVLLYAAKTDFFIVDLHKYPQLIVELVFAIFFFVCSSASIISRCSPFKDSRKGQKMN